jgi:hypothetical protein
MALRFGLDWGQFADLVDLSDALYRHRHGCARQGRPVIGGQIVQSSPGGLCMRCMSFLTDEKLAAEAPLYGNAGHRPKWCGPTAF